MEMVNVVSSDVRRIGFENGTMLIEFHSGGIYEYHGVSETLFNAFATSPSKGRFYRNFVKGNFGETRVSPSRYTQLLAGQP